eukprot:scaffold13472_cov129-Isochrysis_galbana.AAC.6
MRLHNFAVPIVPHPAERNNEQQQKVEGEARHAPAADGLIDVLLDGEHLLLRVLLKLRDDGLRRASLLQLLLHVAQLVGLDVDRRARHRHSGRDRGQLELHLRLKLGHVCGQCLDGTGLRPQHTLRRPLQLLKAVEPRLVVQDWVRHALEVAGLKVDDVVVIHQVAGGRRDGEVRAGRDVHVAHLEAVVPLAVVADARLLKPQLELPRVVRDVHARVVEHRDILPRLVVPEVVGAPRIVPCPRQDLLRLVKLLFGVGDVVLRAIVQHRVYVWVFVMVLLVDVLEGVEEDAKAFPVVFPAKYRTLDHVVPRGEPDGDAVAKQVLRLAGRAKLHREAPVGRCQGVPVPDPALLALLLRSQPHEPVVGHRRSAQFPVVNESHTRERVDSCERCLEGMLVYGNRHDLRGRLCLGRLLTALRGHQPDQERHRQHRAQF